MRALVTILVAAMSVTTGGPLRCPCQISALFRTNVPPSSVASPPVPAPETSCTGCGCRSHRQTPEPGPTQDPPADGSPKCPHGPALDLAPPHITADRSGVGMDAGDSAVPLAGTVVSVCSASGHRPAVSPSPHSTPPDHLRYCHSFRC